METDKRVSFRRLEYIMMNDSKDPKKNTTEENKNDSQLIAEYVEHSDADFAEDSCELLVGWSHHGWTNHGGGEW